MVKLSLQLSKLSDIPEPSIEKLLGLVNGIVALSVYDNMLDNEEVTEIDLGFGTLNILSVNEGIKFRYVPSKNIQDDLTKIINGKEPSTLRKLEKYAIKQITELYKDLI